jgi:hypothetical protein
VELVLFTLCEVFMSSSLSRIIFSLGCIVLLGLSGCAHYKAQSLNRFKQNRVLQQEKPMVSFAYDLFNIQDCKRYLDRNVIAKGYQPIHIMITNYSNRYLELSLDHVSLPLIKPQEVARFVHTSTAKRVIIYGVIGLFIWPFLIPAVVDGIGSEKANERLDADFARKALRSQIIAPHGSVSGLVFVDTHDFDENFTVTLIDRDSRECFVLGSMNPFVKE